MKIIGYVILSIILVQVYYIIIHYEDIVSYVDRYKNYRYGIDIVPQYIDPSTSDYNDTIAADVKTKRRCASSINNGGLYVIVSSDGYAVDSNNTLVTFQQLISCVIEMTENYSSYLLSNPCLSNILSPACSYMLSLL